jgi:hypothetical protein
MWCLATIGLVFFPFVLSVFIDHLFTLKIEDIKNLSTINLPGQQQEVPPVQSPNTLSIKDVPVWLMQNLGRLPQCLLHLPIIQTMNHIMVWLQLNKACLKFEDVKQKQKLTTNVLEVYRKKAGAPTLEQEVNACKQVVSTIQCKFQETKLLEAFGESAPQFALQVAIMIKLGHISPFQIFTVSTSIFSCTMAASNVYLKLASKLNDIPHQDWKNLVLVFPAMLFNSLPRLLTISLIVAYMGPWSLIALALAFGLNCLVELFLLGVNHQSENIKGIFIAMIVPCIVIDQYSKFLLKTSICNAFIYVILVGLLFALVDSGFVAPAIDSLPPFMHCFHPVEWIPMANQTRCLYNGTILQDCLDSMITMSEEFDSGYVPICQPDEEVWHRLDPVCIFLVGLFIISVGFSYFLHWYLDPINRLRATSWWCLKGVWDPSNDYLKKAVKTLVFQKKYPQYEQINGAFEKEHHQSLLYCAIDKDLNQFVEVLVVKCNADENRKNQQEGTSKPEDQVSALEAASTHGRLRTLKILIAQVKNKGKWMCRCGWVKTFGPD